MGIADAKQWPLILIPAHHMPLSSLCREVKILNKKKTTVKKVEEKKVPENKTSAQPAKKAA